ncbi:MAG: alpha/beta fold hydrolase [bacterium]|nr:alpha/beta fold hydrolase [bacterium]
MRFQNSALAACLVAFSTSCIAHEQYRKDYTVCTSAEPADECGASALHGHESAGGKKDFFLGFIEFDDQGALWDRDQASAVIDHLLVASGQEELLLVVFVHGWKHSAAPGDENIKLFRDNLARLSKIESRVAKMTGAPERKVAGVYLGWRGGSVSLSGLEQLTFWDRKSTAHTVGHGDVVEVLGRLEQVRDVAHGIDEGSRTRLVVIGHSFGGAVVYSALAQILQERFLETTKQGTASRATRGFGDLVVLINPAFEAQRYSSLSDMSTDRGDYSGDQLPVLAILTSEGDAATRVAFPVGRFFSTLFEKERIVERPNGYYGETELIDQGAANVRAVGHFAPYRTHTLEPDSSVPLDDQAASIAFLDVSEAWENDRAGETITFPGTVLERSETSAPRSPYLVIRVSDEIIPDHSDIDDERVVLFLSQLILLSSQEGDPKLRAAARGRAREEL